jgi:hypothetical protein
MSKDGAGECRDDPYSAAGLPESLSLVALALKSGEAAKIRYPNYRLTRLVADRLDMDETDIANLSAILGTDLVGDADPMRRPFDLLLRRTITKYALGILFYDDGLGVHHQSIRPKGYDFFDEEVIALDMERWRADYRAMSLERQMLAASILWLFRGGADNFWLRRVPCTWHAADAIARMKEAGVLEDWARLLALYPGW